VTFSVKSLMASVLLPLTLIACDEDGPSQRYSLATVPADLRQCVVQTTGVPANATLTRQQVAELIFRLRRSEQRLSACGQRILSLYDSQSR
jgi:hypothetical protein